MQKYKPVGSVENAIAILNLLAISKSGLRLLDISQRLSINSSTCLAILRTLVAHDAVALDREAKRYSLGGYIGHLHDLQLNKFKVERAASQMMADLARTYDVIVTMWTKTDDRTLTLTSVFESDGEMRISMRLGLTRPIYFGSIGRIYAACTNPPDEVLTEACAEYEWQNPPPPEVFLQEIAQAREAGWAVDYGYALIGMCSIAVPLREAGAPMVRCVSAGMFQGVYDDEARRAAIITRMREIQALFEQE